MQDNQKKWLDTVENKNWTKRIKKREIEYLIKLV